MKVIESIADLRALIGQAKKEGKTVGLVPTMGYLHDGHLSLMRTAKSEHDVVVASIFVNPIQFGPGEDYEVYPRDIERDARLAESAGVDVVFAPTVEEMYPGGYHELLTFVDVEKITNKLCGAHRPGHFRGVTTVVTKLFNIVKPDTAYFGQKDAQQVMVIKRMVKDLNIDINIRIVPIVREKDGLALSSRNVYLNAQERKAALILYKALEKAKTMLTSGEKCAEEILIQMEELIKSEPCASVDYIEIVDTQNLKSVNNITDSVLIALAVRIGKVRLIDNIIWEG